MIHKILLSKIAKKDLRNILLSLKEKTEDLNLILQHQSEIIDNVFSLDIFPERYPLYHGKYNKQNFRKMVTKHYIILYSIKNKTVIINKILAQGMSIKKSAFADFLMYFYAFMLLFVEYAIYIDGIKDTF